MTTNDDIYRLTGPDLAGICDRPRFDPDRGEWIARCNGWEARAEKKATAILLAFAGWLDAVPDGCADAVRLAGDA